MTDARPGEHTSLHLTRVLLSYEHQRASRRLFFGEPVRRQSVGRGVSHAFFEPSQTFCYVVWEAGSYGTKHWSLVVCRAGRPGETLDRLDGVEPGVRILLRAGTAHYVHKALAVMDEIVEDGAALTTVPDAYWRAVQVAFDGRKPAPPFQRSNGSATARLVETKR
ncbi:DUF2840 domain-containing protein [Parvularcula oceani]|uniref:DUF2840 domain-containing protein n=1 Tax=Parvularcula oceani TaxID=1247963 RepID=UPI00068E7513|nr:DUF2840 domain-containing protein [Parvularcula oceani]